jgi:hypothetical protein
MAGDFKGEPMAHVNSHKEPRRAKMLDLANQSVKGSTGSKGRHGRPGWKRLAHHSERRYGDQTYRHLRDFRCSGEVECDCPGCSCELGTPTRDPREPPGYTEVAPPLDDLAGAFRSAEKWAFRLGSSDALLSWLKENYPDTLAGRHVIDHIMESLDWVVQCKCKELRNASGKGNHGQCTCKAFLLKRRTPLTLDRGGRYRRRRRRRLGSR